MLSLHGTCTPILNALEEGPGLVKNRSGGADTELWRECAETRKIPILIATNQLNVLVSARETKAAEKGIVVLRPGSPAGLLPPRGILVETDLVRNLE